MNTKGEMKKFWIGKTLIHSDHRFTYEDVQQIIETGGGTYKDEILLLNSIAQIMRKERFRNCAITKAANPNDYGSETLLNLFSDNGELTYGMHLNGDSLYLGSACCDQFNYTYTRKK